jgi:hypothetical protein
MTHTQIYNLTFKQIYMVLIYFLIIWKLCGQVITILYICVIIILNWKPFTFQSQGKN